jgi:2-polyprenyl-6-hydroxyphenyl methylase/3-demethylubiquinone-9 3-methyltransferase
MTHDLTTLDRHFAFGENWASYAQGVGESEIEEAQAGLKRLLGDTDLKGKRFLDIGCGSGIHSLAAIRLGAASVVAVDLDPGSVATARAVLERHGSGGEFKVEQISVFELDPVRLGTFDVVYSWGVLHHTGDMHRALRKAAGMTAPGGMFLFALYRRTWLCSLWTLEKQWYAKATPAQQKWARGIYLFLFRLGLWVTGRSMGRYMANYRTRRGMDFPHDVHDWLGGYPYESISPGKVDDLMKELGFTHVRSFLISRWRKPVKLFGSGCDEYVYRRNASAQA